MGRNTTTPIWDVLCKDKTVDEDNPRRSVANTSLLRFHLLSVYYVKKESRRIK